MPRVAVVDNLTNIVTAIIVAEANDSPYFGTTLIDVDNLTCDVGWVYDPVLIDFTNPNPPPEEPERIYVEEPPPESEGG